MFFSKTKKEIQKIVPIEKQYEIVSLGCYCIARTVLTRQGLKPRKAQGELSCPFDLVLHDVDRVTHYIKNDFESYFDDLYYKKYKRYWFDFRNKGIWKKRDNTAFFHDKDCKENDKEKLINRVSSRIDNFRKIVSNERPIFFVQALKSDEDIENLYKELKILRGEKFFKLIILDLKDIVKKEISGVEIIKVPFPSKKYEKYWDKHRYYKSKEGINFEKTLTIKVEEVIKKYI